MYAFAKSRFCKTIALLLIPVLLTDVIKPRYVFALTSGPGQPEFEGFTEADLSQSVDPFTGNFTYQLALLTVPGPNGGYPVNLVYNSGIGMEDEASWVGLGWSLNAGAINRNVRGLPDEFSGPVPDKVDPAQADYVKKTMYMKPNWTIGLGVSVSFPPVEPPEVYNVPTGFDANVGGTANLKLYYNSYTGPGYTTGLSPALTVNMGAVGKLSAGANLNFDSNDGPSINPNVSFGTGIDEFQANTAFGMGYSSRQGITGMNYSLNTSFSAFKQGRTIDRMEPVDAGSSETKRIRITEKNGVSFQGPGLTLNYAAASGIPSVTIPMKGYNAGFQIDLQFGPSGLHPKTPVGFEGYFNINSVADYIRQGYAYPAYGLLNAQYRYNNPAVNDERALMDYDREKNIPVNMKTPMLPLPVLTHDIYSVSGAEMGGTFRAHRNDAGIFYDAAASSDFIGISIGGEVATGTGVKFGVDPTVSYTNSYSGKWQSDDKSALDLMGFKAFDTPQPLRKTGPFYFRFSDEKGMEPEGYNSMWKKGGNGAAAFSIGPALSTYPGYADIEGQNSDPDAIEQMENENIFGGENNMKAATLPLVGGMAYSPASFVNREPAVRNTLVAYKTKTEKTALGEPGIADTYTGSVENPVSLSDFEIQGNTYVKDHHLAEFTIIKNTGMKYVYATPLYNTRQDEIFFSLAPGQPMPYQTDGIPPPKTLSVPALMTVIQNGRGQASSHDEAYSRNSTDPYAHTHLLTYITSPDYVDVGANGPGDEDMGYWAKFNYYPVKIFRWRMPYGLNTVNYSTGYASSPRDDKASVSYGEKQIRYLHSIETKTHIAFFYLSPRSDANGVTGINGAPDNSIHQERLDAIKLFSKNDLGTPIKTVHFVYADAADELCHQVPNASAGRGKLTLEEVYFTYNRSSKKVRYRFGYGHVFQENAQTGFLADAGTVNKAYEAMGVDRWGSHSWNTDPENPYTDQHRDGTTETKRKEAAVTWNLTRIELPTGGVVRVDYESDDYAYVQDEEAMQMVKIIGTGTTDGNTIRWLSDSSPVPISEAYQRIYFEPLEPLQGSHSQKMAQVKRYVNGLRDNLVYFKVWERLQVPKNRYGWAYDYVTGYARISPGDYGYTQHSSGTDYPYITLQPADDAAGHYFRTAGFQYLRYSRSDLSTASPDNPDPISLITIIVDVVMQTVELMSGYYRYSLMKDNCKEIGEQRDSYLRLYTPDGVKYGGGHRVRKLTVSDRWEGEPGTVQQYGTRYLYKLDDGRSSGVASYEPLLGNDENAMKHPHMYGPDNKFSNNNDAFFEEEPFGENFFPSPTVGYSRVTMVNIVNNRNMANPDHNITKSADGIRIKKFYTAKDFPIITEFTPVNRVDESTEIPIPVVGCISLQSKGYSQGYYIETNDMHGKPREELVYDADFWDKTNQRIVDNAPYVSKTACTYFTDDDYFEGAANHLKNTVPVQLPDGQETVRELGVNAEMYAHMAEDKTYTVSGGANVGGGMDPAPIGLFIMVTPSISYSENDARVVTTTKVVQRQGMVKEMYSYQNGVSVTTRNLLFDAETAQPVLTAVTDDYDNPNLMANDRLIYTRQYPAYWYYEGMGPAYRNYRFSFTGNPAAFADAGKYFVKGDEVLCAGQKYWIKDVLNTGFTLVNAAGTTVTPTGTFVVYRSGYRNQQSVMSGSLVSLDKPTERTTTLFGLLSADYLTHITGSTSPVFNTELFAPGVGGVPPESIPVTSREVTLCNGAKYAFRLEAVNPCHPQLSCGVLHIRVSVEQTEGSEAFDDCSALYIFNGSWSSFRFSKLGVHYQDPMLMNSWLTFTYDGVPIAFDDVLGVTTGYCPENVKKTCMENILHADATEFTDEWNYKSEFKTPSAFWTANNDYILGKRGIWRTKRANVYFTERRQYGTHDQVTPQFGVTSLRRDGTYLNYVVFDRAKTNAGNQLLYDGWRWAAEVPEFGYNPFGFEIENRDALGICSSAMYGYSNSVPVAVAKNAAYAEIGFDGFEEYAPFTGNIPHVKRGHLPIKKNDGSEPPVTDTKAHTGFYSLHGTDADGLKMVLPLVSAFSETVDDIQLMKGKKYVVGFWYYSPYIGNNYNNWQILVKRGNSPTPTTFHANYYLAANTSAIEGWRRFEGVLDLSGITTDTYLGLFLEGMDVADIYIDDVRIMPFDANMQTYVYNQKDLKLSAQLDENNFATFYNYDEEGNLVQVKKETERGIMTVQQTRKNVRK